MRNIAIAGLVIAAVASAGPGARAGSDSTYRGGCSVAVISDAVAGQGQQTGEIDVEAVVYSPTPEGNPVSATITCLVKVNGVSQPDAVVVASGTVAIVGGDVITYTSASAADSVELCQILDYTGPGDTTATSETCWNITYEIPPSTCVGNCLEAWVDAVACTAFSAVSGTHGPVFVNEQGDVYIDGEPWFDCPPYDIDWG